jgi:hypothetical protein
VQTVVIRVDEPEEEGSDYPVKLLLDDGNEDWLERPLATAAIGHPLPEPNVEQLETAAGGAEAIQGLLSTHPRSPAFESVGVYLHDLIAGEEIRREWELLRRDPGGRGVRALLDVRPRELRALPWELMRAGDSPLPLFVDEGNPCARVHRLDGAHLSRNGDETLECSPLLKVLIVVGAKPDDEDVQATREVEGVCDGLSSMWGFVDVEILDLPTLQQLEDRYTEFRPHILHFVGHGREPQAGGGLIVAGRQGADGWTWTPAAIAAVLAAWRPRLALLNACRSATRRGLEGAWQVADALLEADVPAVLAMHGNIRGDTAAAFASALYKALASEQPLDVAVVKARRAIGQNLNADYSHRDLWLPCLWLSALPERILPRRCGVRQETQRLIERDVAFASMQRFVNRAHERRRLWRGLEDGESQQRSGVALAVTGSPNVGKSALVKWALGLAALRGVNVAYVDLERTAKIDFVDVLMAIEAALRSSPHHGEANRPRFERFAALRASLPATSRQQANLPEDIVEQLFDVFKQALVAAADGGDVLLALDHIRCVEPAYWRLVAERLVAPIASGQLSVRLIVVHNSDEDPLPGELTALVEPIKLSGLPPADFRQLTRRYLRAQGYAGEKPDAFIHGLEMSLQDSWDGKIFTLLDTVAQTFGWEKVA